MYLNCAFTGHRYDTADLDTALLDRIILNLMKGGTKNFYCGMAMGFDLTAAQIVLKYKNLYGAKLIACVPCPEQADGYSQKDREIYNYALSNCDVKIMLAPYYFSGCMHRRDRFLVDNCNVLISYLRSESGGTYYTVNYARKVNANIIEI